MPVEHVDPRKLLQWLDSNKRRTLGNACQCHSDIVILMPKDLHCHISFENTSDFVLSMVSTWRPSVSTFARFTWPRPCSSDLTSASMVQCSRAARPGSNHRQDAQQSLQSGRSVQESGECGTRDPRNRFRLSRKGKQPTKNLWHVQLASRQLVAAPTRPTDAYKAVRSVEPGSIHLANFTFLGLLRH